MYPDYYNMYNQYYGFKGPDYRSSEPQNGSGEIITFYYNLKMYWKIVLFLKE